MCVFVSQFERFRRLSISGFGCLQRFPKSIDKLKKLKWCVDLLIQLAFVFRRPCF